MEFFLVEYNADDIPSLAFYGLLGAFYHLVLCLFGLHDEYDSTG